MMSCQVITIDSVAELWNKILRVQSNLANKCLYIFSVMK